MTRARAASFILRLGVTFAFLYPPLSALTDPYAWLGYFPHFLRGHVPDLVLLHAFGFLEVVIALWILSGRRIFVPATLATLLLLAIVLFDARDFQILFRDLAIAAAALSLAITAAPRRLAASPESN